MIACTPSQISSQGLLTLDGLEEGFEVADAEALMALPLDALEKYRRPVLARAHEDLKQVSLVVEVDENVEALDLIQVLRDLQIVIFFVDDPPLSQKQLFQFQNF